MRATRIARAILALALALALVGCKSGDDTKDETKKTEKKAKVKKDSPEAKGVSDGDPALQQGPEPAKGDGTPGDPAGKPAETAKPATRPVLLESKALEMIPGSALLVAAVTGVEPLADRIGWAELRLIKRDWYEMAVAMVVQFVGHNVLDFANLPEIGVDPNAPMGFAWLDWEGEAVAGWIQLSDPEKFKVTLYKIAGLANEELTPETMGDALILSLRHEDEVKIVLRGDFAFLVFSDDGGKEAMGFARRVASTERSMSILEVDRFKDLMAGLESGRDGALYVDVGAIVKKAFDQGEGSREATQKNWAQTELENAKERGADQEELDRLTKQADEEKAWQERYRQRRKAEADLARKLWGGLGAVAVGAEIGRNAVNAHAVAAVDGGMVIELFGKSTGRPLITKVVSGKPWFLAGATVDVATYRNLFETLLATEGTEWSEVEGGALEHLGLNLQSDLLAALDGQVGFYMGGTFSAKAEPPEAFKNIEGGAYVGIKDGARLTALLAKVALHNADLAKLITPADGGGWAIAVPEWRTVIVKVVDGYLVAATDTAFIDRVAKGGGGDWPASTGNDDLVALFTGSEANAAWMMDMGLVGYMTFARFGAKMEQAASVAPGLDDAPYSQAWKDKDKEIKDTEKAVEEAQTRLEEEEFAVLKAMFGAFGVTAAVGGPGPLGLQVKGGQYFGLESIPAVGKEIATRAFEMEALSSRRRTEIWERQDGLWQKRQELQQIRQKDIEEYMKTKLEAEMKTAKEGAEAAAQAAGVPAPVE
jgi:hypothetical protein